MVARQTARPLGPTPGKAQAEGKNARSEPGRSGVAGALRLVFRARAGPTYLADQFVQPPLKIVRPLRLPDGSAVLQVTGATPGALAGDAFRVEITVEEGAHAIVLGGSATKVHAMPDGGEAVHETQLTV